MSGKMIIIDGSQGEGGGQIFRTSLTLAMCLGKSICIKNIRAGRKKPGLLRQHLACLNAAQKICSAKISGDELGSREVTFIPGEISAGSYVFSVGSAGSTTLIFQTVFPALAIAKDESYVTFEGGTHNGMAPSYDFIEKCFIPIVKSIGYKVESTIEKYGFYPSGGGRWCAHITPHQGIEKLHLLERGEVYDTEAVVTQAKVPEHVADRELLKVEKKLGLNQDKLKKNIINSVGPGNIVSLRLSMRNLTEVFESIGERGLSAERVAGRAVENIRNYLSAEAPVGEYLADQLILPLLLGNGGRFRTCEKSEHLTTNINVVNQIANASVSLTCINENEWEVSIY